MNYIKIAIPENTVNTPDFPVALMIKSDVSAIVISRPMSTNQFKDTGSAIYINSFSDLLKHLPEYGELIVVGNPANRINSYIYGNKDEIKEHSAFIIHTLFYELNKAEFKL